MMIALVGAILGLLLSVGAGDLGVTVIILLIQGSRRRASSAPTSSMPCR
jgi:hypothetical protein